MTESIINRIKETKFVDGGDSILIGFSGGPDSVCLLHALHQLSEPLSLKLYAAHLNHHLRGMDSNEDAAFAVNFSREREIVCLVKSVDVVKYAEKHGMSLETAGRACRYQFFEEVAVKVKADKIALGHHRNDQAETLLMNLIRGTGLEGLTGMPPVRGKIIRPLIRCSRKEIEDYCHRLALPYRVDHTNKETAYFRNKVRIHLIPQLETYQPKVLESIGKTAELLEQDKAYFEEVVSRKFQEIVVKTNRDHIKLDRTKLEGCHPAILSRVLRKAYYSLEKSGQTLQYDQLIGIIEGLSKGKTEKTYQLPGKIAVLLRRQEVYFTGEAFHPSDHDHAKKTGEMQPISLKIPGITNLPSKKGSIHCEVLNVEKVTKTSRDPFCQMFDMDLLPINTVLRNRREGDWIKPLGMTGTKKLKDFLIDQKIPLDERNKTLLLACGQEILWIVGHRISESIKISKKTRKVVRMHYRPHREKEGLE